jgi:hypothetical protein
MYKDSLQLTITIDSTSIATQQINNQFTKTDKTVGSGLIGLWMIGLILTIFVFKRPNK